MARANQSQQAPSHLSMAIRSSYIIFKNCPESVRAGRVLVTDYSTYPTDTRAGRYSTRRRCAHRQLTSVECGAPT